MWFLLESGEPLDQVIEVPPHREPDAPDKHITAHTACLLRQFALTLQGKTRALADFSDTDFDEASFVVALTPSDSALYQLMKLIAAFLATQYDEARQWADSAAPMLVHVDRPAVEVTHHVYHALTLAALHTAAPAEQQRQLSQRLADILLTLKQWGARCPEHVAHGDLLVCAEIARIDMRDMDAMRLYDQAIDAAQNSGLLQMTALATETAARFYRARGFGRIADTYLRAAHTTYAQWGAHGKLYQLEQDNPHLRASESQEPISHASLADKQVNMLAVVQACQAISSDIVLDQLLKTLMSTVLENTGAQQGHVLLNQNKNKKLSLAAHAHVEHQTLVLQTPDQPGFAALTMPNAIIDQVVSSQRRVILNDLSRDNPYSRDAYFKHRRPKSLVCLPVASPTRLIGVLYLESDVTPHAFTPDRLSLLELLATQAAIALDNAQAYAILQESEDRLHLTLETANIGTWFWDVEHDLWSASPTYYTMLGYPPESGPGDRAAWMARLHPDDLPVFVAKMKEVVSRNFSDYEYELRLRHADGSYRWQHVKGFGIKRDQEGKATQMLGIRMDISQRKEDEEKLKQLNTSLDQRVKDRTIQLEAANKELEAFSYSVSHDLRAPLRHIDGFLDLLRARTNATLDDKSRHYMDTISNAAKSMGTLIDDLLAFSRMNRSEMLASDIDLGFLVQEIIRECQHETKGRDISWHIGELPPVTGDAAMLRMVLVNLISNALKFTQHVEKTEIEIACQPGPEPETVVFVKDNGAGFDMRYADKLFGVFQRLHRNDEFEGTGIGLANVRRIIGRHGGRTWAEGQVGQGATFYFSLPHTRPSK